MANMSENENRNNVIREGRNSPEEVNKREELLNDQQLCALRKIIYKIYTVDKEIPTLNKIIIEAKEQINYNGSKTLLRKLLSEKLWIKFKICKNNGPLPIERHKVIYHRCNFLQQLQENESLGLNKKPVIYFDEISLNNIKEPDSLGEKWFLLFAGGPEGFIKASKLLQKTEPLNGSFKKMTNSLFLNWLKNILIPKLPPNSIVIFDSAPQHNKLKEVIPNEFSTRKDMQNWLKKHNISFEDDWLRLELLCLIKKHMPENNYKADDILEKAGHMALRLPILTDLNPMEKYLNKIKENVTKCYSTQSGVAFEEIINSAVDSLSDDDWLKEVEHTNSLVNDYLEKENLLDDATDKLDISFEESEGDVLSSDSGDYLTDFSYDSSDISEDSDSFDEDYVSDESGSTIEYGDSYSV